MYAYVRFVIVFSSGFLDRISSRIRKIVSNTVKLREMILG
jgi:hypothetical protein